MGNEPGALYIIRLRCFATSAFIYGQEVTMRRYDTRTWFT